jgi:hypothetical protein
MQLNISEEEFLLVVEFLQWVRKSKENYDSYLFSQWLNSGALKDILKKST